VYFDCAGGASVNAAEGLGLRMLSLPILLIPLKKSASGGERTKCPHGHTTNGFEVFVVAPSGASSRLFQRNLLFVSDPNDGIVCGFVSQAKPFLFMPTQINEPLDQRGARARFIGEVITPPVGVPPLGGLHMPVAGTPTHSLRRRLRTPTWLRRKTERTLLCPPQRNRAFARQRLDGGPGGVIGPKV
jgi:hypothetical protein